LVKCLGTSAFLARRQDESDAEPGPGAMPAFRGVIGARWSYGSGEQELYDMAADPYQLRNVMARPRRSRTAEQVAALRDARRALRRLTGCSGVADCRR
jgi:hypothetical protein